MSETLIYSNDEINTGDVLLVGGRSFLSRAIKWFEKCPYSHAAMFFWIREPKLINDKLYPIGLYVAEMVAKGFVLTPFESYMKGHGDLLCLKPEYAVDEKAYWDFITPDLGHEKYGFVNLLLCQPIKFLTGYRIWLGDVDDEHPNRYICGEKVEEIINHFTEYFGNWMRDDPSIIYKSPLFTQHVILTK